MNRENPFALNEFDTTAVFIDGPGLYWAFKAVDSEAQMDFLALRDLIADNSRMQNINYYTVLPPRERRDATGHTPIIPLTDMLGFNGFRVQKKEAYTIQTDLGLRSKGSITLDLALDADNAGQQGINHIMLFLNDDDYTPLIDRLQARQCRVTIVSTKVKGVIPEDMVWGADNFIDLKDVKELITRRRRGDD